MNRNFKYDLIRTIAIIFVVFVHALGLVNKAVVQNMPFGKLIQSIYDIVNGGVPLFIMISGALLLGKVEPVGDFFRKRMNKILLPFLLWSFVCCTIHYVQDGGRSVIECLTSFVAKLMTGDIHTIYWYVYMIIGLYLITPFLRVVVQSNRNLILYLTALLLLVTISKELFPKLVILSRMTNANSGALFYFVFGFVAVEYLQPREHFARVSRIAFLLLFISNIVIRIVFDYKSELIHIALFISLYCALISLKLKNQCDTVLCRVVSEISKMSYGIYLSHFMLISVVVKMGWIKQIPLAIEPIVVVFFVLLLDTCLLQVFKKIGLQKYTM